MSTQSRTVGAVITSLTMGSLIVGLASCGGGGDGSEPPSAQVTPATVTVLSSRPDMVSESSTLLRVDVPQVIGAAPAKISLAGADVTSQFKTAADGSLQGVVSALPDGKNTISVAFNGTTSTVDVVSHGRNGPIISGPQQKPFICQTASFALPDGSTLGQPQDVSCNTPTKVLFLYRPTAGAGYKVMPSGSSVPADVAKTTTTDGRSVNYIVRLETGTLNRGVYQFAVLYDPTVELAPSPTTQYQGWNRKLIFTFGGSLTSGYVQGTTTGGVLNDFMLSKGFAVISSSLNVFATIENDVISAESASMTKEKFIKLFGPPVYTMGWGSSGGAMQQQLIASNYPGLLDGIVPGSSFADLFSLLPGDMDCSLMSRAFSASGLVWSNAQKTAVSGFIDYSSCTGMTPVNFSHLGLEQTYSPSLLVAARFDPNFPFVDIRNCGLPVPDALVYNPIANRGGARCDAYTANINELGIEPTTGFAARAIDNVGVQYGLKIVQSSAITVEQFVDLNERIGGYDSDGNFQSARSVASSIGLNSAYAFGRVNEGQRLGDLPIIDDRPYREPDIHDSVRSLVTRQRMAKAGASTANQIILRHPLTQDLSAIVLDQMDRWLSALVVDAKTYATRAAKISANKPSDLVESCYSSTGTKIAEPADINNGGQCGALYPFFSDPRMVAGAPMADDVLKCQLKPLQRSDYAGITDSQFARLGVVFPTGVCDYSKPSVGFQPLLGTWLSYSSPGVAVALPPSP